MSRDSFRVTPSSNLSAMTKWEIEEKDLKEIYIFRGRESERRERGKKKPRQRIRFRKRQKEEDSGGGGQEKPEQNKAEREK